MSNPPHPSPPASSASSPSTAAWHANPQRPPGRRYFLDDCVVRYAPSATTLGHAAQVAVTVGTDRLLAIDEPAMAGAGRLPNSATARGGGHRRPFHRSYPAGPRRGDPRPRCWQPLAAPQVAHFSCHGANNWNDPLASGLLMAGGERLTVADVLKLRLGEHGWPPFLRARPASPAAAYPTRR